MRNISFIVLLAIILSCNTNSNDTNQSPEIKFSLDQMDKSIDPCDDFFSYATGTWIKENPIPETEGRWSGFNVLIEENKQKCIAILDKLLNTSYEKGSVEGQLKTFYQSALAERDDETALAFLTAIHKDIKLADSYEKLVQLFGGLAQQGIGSPLRFSIGADKKNSAINQVYVSQAGLTLPDRDYYLSQDSNFVSIREKYVEHMKQMQALTGIEAYRPLVVLSIEEKLAGIQWSRVKSRDPQLSYDKQIMTSWNSAHRNIDFHMVAEAAGFKPIDTVIVSQNTYFNALDSLFKTISIDEWKEYLTWKMVNSYAAHLTTKTEREHFNFFSTTLRGIKEMKPLKERVYISVNGMLGELLGQLYVKEHFNPESKAYVSEMIEDIRKAYRISINELSWMSDETKQKAIRKLESFTYKVGYPEEWKDYSDLTIEEERYLNNLQSARRFNYQFMLEKQGKPVDRKEWHMHPQTVNAYYNSANNEIVFPAAILQPPFFHINYDKAVNYGGIGAVIGHEFSHGFDDRGSQFDWNGNLSSWWTKEDRQRFEALAQSLIDQYNEYSPLEGYFVNGKYTIGENIADLGGVTISYEALKLAYQGNYPDSLDGYSWNQRFFLAYANIWKGHMTNEESIRRIKSDPHSPGKFRVIGPLVNIPYFNEAFGTCPGKGMYKPDSLKIKIW